MTDLITFIVLSFATYRLSRLIVSEDAPFSIMRRIRETLGADQATCENQRQHGVTNVLCCVNCASIWVAAALVLVFQMPVEWVFALSGVTVYLYER